MFRLWSVVEQLALFGFRLTEHDANSGSDLLLFETCVFRSGSDYRNRGLDRVLPSEEGLKPESLRNVPAMIGKPERG